MCSLDPVLGEELGRNAHKSGRVCWDAGHGKKINKSNKVLTFWMSYHSNQIMFFYRSVMIPPR